MQLCPKARDEEFVTALSLLQPSTKNVVLDVPAGGAYLREYLNNDIQYQGFDFSTGFNRNQNVEACTETYIPLPDSSVDKAICLAAIHHVEHKAEFVKELHRCLAPYGRLVIGDIIANSEPADFLNGFVDTWNSLGHDGDFIKPRRDIALLEHAGFKARFQTNHYHWNFANSAECHNYLRQLFALDKRPSTNELNDAIQTLGVTESASGFRLNWSLGFLIATKQ